MRKCSFLDELFTLTNAKTLKVSHYAILKVLHFVFEGLLDAFKVKKLLNFFTIYIWYHHISQRCSNDLFTFLFFLNLSFGQASNWSDVSVIGLLITANVSEQVQFIKSNPAWTKQVTDGCFQAVMKFGNFYETLVSNQGFGVCIKLAWSQFCV